MLRLTAVTSSQRICSASHCCFCCTYYTYCRHAMLCYAVLQPTYRRTVSFRILMAPFNHYLLSSLDVQYIRRACRDKTMPGIKPPSSSFVTYSSRTAMCLLAHTPTLFLLASCHADLLTCPVRTVQYCSRREPSHRLHITNILPWLFHIPSPFPHAPHVDRSDILCRR